MKKKRHDKNMLHKWQAISTCTKCGNNEPVENEVQW